MENIRTMKLEEIRETLEELKARIAEVEAQLAELQSVTDNCREDGAESLAEEVFVGESQEEMRMEPQEDIPEEIAEAVTEEAEAVPIDISIDDLDIEPVRFEPEPVVVENAKPIEAKSLEEAILESDLEKETGKTLSINDKEEKRARKAVVDVLGEKFPWRTAVQGSPVKNVISAISLNDRVLFINTLFKEDPLAFQDAIAAFNSMTTLEEAEKYVFDNFPEWNFSSDTVFKLMMAVRRKLD